MGIPGYTCGHYSDAHNPNPDTAVPSLCENCIRRHRDTELFKISVRYSSRIEHAEREALDHMGQDEELNKKCQDLHERMAKAEEKVHSWYAETEGVRRALVKAMC